MDTLRDDHYTFLIISRSVLLTMRNVSDKSCREKQNTHFVFNNVVFFPENYTVNEIVWKNIAVPGRPQMAMWCVHIAGWIPKATNTYSQYTLLTDFPLQQRLQKHPSILMLYLHCVSCSATALCTLRPIAHRSHAPFLTNIALFV